MNTLGLAVDAIVKRSMKALLVLALLLAPTAMLSQTLSNQYKHIVSTWTPPNTTYPNCSVNVTNTCLLGYSELLTPPTASGGSTVTIPVCPLGSNVLCIGPVATYSWTSGSYLYVGTWGVSLTAIYLDPTGNQISASAVTTTVVVPSPFVPSPAGGITAVPAP